MPTLGADMSAGTLQAWLKHPGDEVKRGDIIAVVETDKADVEVEVFAGGVIEKLLVDPGAKVPVGTPLAFIRAPGEEPAAQAPAVALVSAPERPASTADTRPARPAERARPSARLLVSPSARQLAAELGVDPSIVEGSGPGGRIQRKDIEAAAAAAVPEAAPTVARPSDERQARMRAAIAAAMSRSNSEIPHLYVTQTVDMSRALAWLEAENARRSVKERLLYGVLLIKAVSVALREVPELNGFWREGRREQSDAVHVGMAISLRGGGLVAPALRDADAKSIDELMAALRDLVQRARAGRVRSSELSDPTITITSLGEQGVEGVLGLIFPPQVAIVGFGKVVERPWAENGGLFVRPVAHASLAADHRVVDGHRAGLFLAAVDCLLQTPEVLAGNTSTDRGSGRP
jgi:pyruvate dehydrogenase E2 component (dihydrolipoamide acetyltransferase)